MPVMHDDPSAFKRISAGATNSAGGARWYAVHTHPRAEEIAARNLDRQAFKVFLPLRVRKVRHARKVKTISDAFFPRYLFVSLDLERNRWHCVNSTIGVAHLLSAGDQPLAVRKGVVESLMSVTGPDGALRPSQLLERGQRIRVLLGPFAGQIGKLDQMDGAGAVHVLLSMMDREVLVRIPRETVCVSA